MDRGPLMAADQGLVTIRHTLHAAAAPAFQEEKTAAIVQSRLHALGLDVVADDVAGHGVLARMGSGSPRVLLRCDMDALPFAEATGLKHAATNGAHHACGHDGHMAMLLGALERLAADPPCEVWALFQPAEETGEGMQRCLQHPAFPSDFEHVFAIHNVPGHPLGTVLVRDGVAAVASTGVRFSFHGETSHAAEPTAGRNPIPAVARLVPLLERASEDGDDQAVAALVQLSGGGPRFGTSAGDALVAATLRAGSDEALAHMLAPVLEAAQEEAKKGGFRLDVERVEPFPATRNDPATVQLVRDAAAKCGLEVRDPGVFPWSEDFGHATARWPGALIGLGSGTDQPALHRPDYDFPDALLPIGVDLWVAVVEAVGETMGEAVA